MIDDVIDFAVTFKVNFRVTAKCSITIYVFDCIM